MDEAIVYILGAGFSRAVSPQMPVTDELGNACVERDHGLSAELGPSPFANGNFETWLSRKAEDQPYFSTAENLSSRAVYARAVDLVCGVLAEREIAALSTPVPAWLLTLIELWHRQRATVITFNYDTLVECALSAAAVYDPVSNITVPWATAINFTPSGRGMTIGEAGQNVDWETFQLLKMHGSLNWYWTPGDVSGATVLRADLPGLFGEPSPLTTKERQRWFPGREPLIVPPAALKSSYYSNPITREIWKRAFEALSAADRVVFLGYSLPTTDLSMSGLISEALSGRPSATVEVVDLRPETIVERVTSLLPDCPVHASAGPDPIELATGRWHAKLRREVVPKLADAARAEGELGVAVSWGEGAMAAATGARREGTKCVVDLEGIGQIWFATRADRGSRREITGHSDEAVLRADQLAATLDGCDTIVARTHDGVELEVFGSHVRDFSGRNSGVGTWFQLVASGAAVRDQVA